MPEQPSQAPVLPVYRDKWIQIIGIDKKTAQSLYRLRFYPKPSIIFSKTSL
jgi:hypothetical protein